MENERADVLSTDGRDRKNEGTDGGTKVFQALKVQDNQPSIVDR